MTLLPQSITTEIEAMLADALAAGHRDAFPLERIGQIAEWCGPISNGLRARALMALHSVNASVAFSEACAEAIAGEDDWRDLLVALLRDTRITPQIVSTALEVLHRRLPGRLPPGLHARTTRAARICDAVDDGTMLRVTRSAWSDLGEGPCWLIGLADPVGQIAGAVASVDGDDVVIDPGAADWLERTRLACPAFLAIIA